MVDSLQRRSQKWPIHKGGGIFLTTASLGYRASNAPVRFLKRERKKLSWESEGALFLGSCPVRDATPEDLEILSEFSLILA